MCSTLEAPKMIVAGDLVYDVAVVNDNSVMESVELPALSEDLIVNLKDSYSLIEQVVSRLPSVFSGNKCVDSCFGAALTAALSLMTPTGGKIVASVGTIPTIGEGRLTSRLDKKLYGQPKEYTLCVPASDWYKHRSLAASAAQISIDLCINGDAEVELASIAAISRYTSGHIYRYSKDNMAGLSAQMERILTRDTAFESVVRIRTSANITAPNFFGHCYVRGPDLLVLPACDTDTAYAVQLQITAPLVGNSSYIQFALLYTTRTRHRRIRVFTIHLPITSSPQKVMNNTDVIAVAAMLSKTCVDLAVNNPLATAQTKTLEKLYAILRYFKKKVTNQGSYSNQVILPEALKMLPFLVHCFLRTPSVRTLSGYETSPDERVANMSLVMTAPIESLLPAWCSWLHAVYFPKDTSNDMPASVLTTMDRLRNDSVFVWEVGHAVHIWIGKAVPPAVLEALGLPQRPPNSSPVTVGVVSLSEEDLSELNERVKKLVATAQAQVMGAQVAPVVYGKSGQTARHLGPSLVEDDLKDSQGYLNFLVAMHKKVIVDS